MFNSFYANEEDDLFDLSSILSFCLGLTKLFLIIRLIFPRASVNWLAIVDGADPKTLYTRHNK